MLIKVKVFPASKEEEIRRLAEKKDSFEVKVREKPIRGEANRAVVNALSNFLDIPKSKIKLVKGFRKRNKIFEIAQ